MTLNLKTKLGEILVKCIGGAVATAGGVVSVASAHIPGENPEKKTV